VTGVDVVRELNIFNCCNAFVAVFNVVPIGKGADTSGSCMCKLPKKGRGHNTLLPQLTAEGADACVPFWLSINTFSHQQYNLYVPHRNRMFFNIIKEQNLKTWNYYTIYM
jgi:hypothetical protein